MIGLLAAVAALGAPPPLEAAVPLPASPLPDRPERFETCTRFSNAAKGKQKSVIETDDGVIGLRCERTDDSIEVCMILDPSNWPERLPRSLGCRVGRRDVVVHPWAAWDPAWTLGGPIELVVRRLSAMQAAWRLPEGSWASASTADGAGATCAVVDDTHLQVRVTPPVQMGEFPCTLSETDGTTHTVPIRLLPHAQ